MTTYESLKAKIKNRPTKKLANNTYIVRDGDNLAVRLHNTNILFFQPDGVITVNTGGWKTMTTKARINDYIGNPRITRDKGLWYWWQGGDWQTWKETRIPFTDGDQIIQGELRPQATPAQDKEQGKLRKQIDKFAQLCAASIPLDPPGPGDCFDCQFSTPDGKCLGDSFNDKEHLLSHMEEGCVVPSLVYRAMKEGSVSQVAWWSAFKKAGEEPEESLFNKINGNQSMLDSIRPQIRRAVNVYMRTRLGLPK